ncbi:MAG: erythromycin esterase family protein [Flavobacteriaceae bacterium]|nr:erythromycin esterase family protein [Flavobacteriaceae bacterium]
MKKIATIYFIISNLVAIAQSFNPVSLNLNEGNDFSFLKSELKGVSIIMLGEKTHNDGNIFELKTNIIKYLHREMGFNVIAFESGTFELWKAQREIKKGVDTKTAIENSVFSIWSKTKEFQSFVEFFDENKNKLKLYGFDNQITGEYGEKELLKELYNYCEIHQFLFDLNQLDLELLLESMFYSGVFDEKDITYQKYNTALISLQNDIFKKTNDEDHFFWSQIIKNLISLGEDYYYSKESIISTFNVNFNDNLRDKQMAKNLLDYIKVHPNEKIICWGANAHFVNNMSSITSPIIKKFKPMGSYLKDKLKTNLYSLALVTAQDSIKLGGEWNKTPIEPLSFEAYLKNIKSSYAFISSNQEAMKHKIKNRLFSPITFINAQLSLLHDGYLYVDKVIPSSFNTLNINTQVNTESKKIVGNSISGYIKDIATKNPIEFVNILIKGTNLGTISNEKGYFELILPFNIKDKSIIISSMGYKSKTFLFNNLPYKIELSNEAIELKEVVIGKKISANSIMKIAIENVKKNYPMQPFNSSHFANGTIKVKDATLLNVDFITDQYDRGYSSTNRPTQNIKEIRWNIKKMTPPKKIRQLFYSQYNSAMYARFMDKRKMKKFTFSIEKEEIHNGKEVYILKFITDRNHFNYTNQIFLSDYSGYIYINKKDFAVVKIIENWNVTDYPNELLYSNEFWRKNYSSKTTTNVILESSYFKNENNLYYLNKSINYINGLLESKNVKEKSSFKEIYTSYWYDFNDNNLDPISFKKENEELKKATFNKIFWDTYKFPE